MSGLKFLLDTNIIVGLLKQNPEVITYLKAFNANVDACAYSAITRMELLGFAGITPTEEKRIQQFLDAMTYLPLDQVIEDEAIRLRRETRLKLPDAIIGATSRIHELQLLTLDKQLQKSFNG